MREAILIGLPFLVGAYLGIIIMAVLAAHGRTRAWHKGYEKGRDDERSYTRQMLGLERRDYSAEDHAKLSSDLMNPGMVDMPEDW